MKIIFAGLAVSLLLLLCACRIPDSESNENEGNSYEFTVNNSFGFNLPARADTTEDILAILQELNPNLLFLRQVHLHADGNRTPFAVSCYTNEKGMSLDSAYFNYTVNAATPAQQAGASESGSSRYVKEGKTLYRKLSTVNDQVLNVMYYFMKKYYDNRMYEIKMSGAVRDSTAILEFMEKVALDAGFVNSNQIKAETK